LTATKILAAVAVVLWLTQMSATAKVGEFTGEDYLRQCTSTDPNWKAQNQTEHDDAVFCVGYIEAAVTFIVFMDRALYCLPANTTTQDILKATVAYMQSHPDEKQYLFASTMLAAVRAQWPCKPK
jgi:hypothetical protein